MKCLKHPNGKALKWGLFVASMIGSFFPLEGASFELKFIGNGCYEL